MAFSNGEGESAHFEEFEHVISNIVIGKPRVKYFEVDVVDVLCDQTWDLGGRIANHVQQGYDIRTPSQVLENFDFSFNLLLLDRFEDFYDALFVVDDVDTLEDLLCWSEYGQEIPVVPTSEYFPRPTLRTIS